jgi:hypothetical protein
MYGTVYVTESSSVPDGGSTRAPPQARIGKKPRRITGPQGAGGSPVRVQWREFDPPGADGSPASRRGPWYTRP